jgi:hypothetical protein
MRKTKIFRSRLGLAVLVAVATAVAIGGVNYASIPDSNGLIHGCVKTAPAANGTHKLSLINAATTSACPSDTRASTGMRTARTGTARRRPTFS